MRAMTSLTRSEFRAAQEAAALLARMGWSPRPVTPPRDWLWDGLSPEGRQRLVDSWQPPGLRWKPEGVPMAHPEPGSGFRM
jgi:hypothetical protein